MRSAGRLDGEGMETMKKGTTVLFAVSVLVGLANPAGAAFTPINDATSGNEIDLWVALDLVARDPGGGFSWTSTDFRPKVNGQPLP